MTSQASARPQPTGQPPVQPSIVDERYLPLSPLQVLARRAREGQLGVVPVLLALIIIVITFQSINSNFISPSNLVNLSTQVAYVGMLAMGINLVLLLGQIDVSLAQIGGLSASIFGVLLMRHGLNPLLCLVIMFVIGIGLGVIQGWFVAAVGIPAFVVTLAGLLAFSGLTLLTLGSQKNLSITDSFLFNLSNFYFPAAIAYVFGAVVVGVFVISQVRETVLRRRVGLAATSYLLIALRAILLGAVLFGFLITINYDFGLGLPFFVFGTVAIGLDLMLRKTRYGQNIYAIGGNLEAARRSGLHVTWIRISVFMIAAGLGTLFGLIKAGVTTNAGSTLVGTQDLLTAIAAAVIGGTSLFGGRGTAWAPVLGALVVASINNGLYLIGFNSDAQQVITALVLLAAVVLDATAQRGQRVIDALPRHGKPRALLAAILRTSQHAPEPVAIPAARRGEEVTAVVGTVTGRNVQGHRPDTSNTRPPAPADSKPARAQTARAGKKKPPNGAKINQTPNTKVNRTKRNGAESNGNNGARVNGTKINGSNATKVNGSKVNGTGGRKINQTVGRQHNGATNKNKKSINGTNWTVPVDDDQESVGRRA